MYFKKALIILVILLGSFVMMSCNFNEEVSFDDNFNEEVSFIDSFKEKVKTTQSFDIETKFDSLYEYHSEDYNTTSSVVNDVNFTVSFTEEAYDMDSKNSFYSQGSYEDQFYKDQGYENGYSIYAKFIGDKKYGKYETLNSSVTSYWVEIGEGESLLSEAEDFLYAYKTKEDVVNLLTSFTDSILDEKDAKDNFLLAESSYELIEECILGYFGYVESEGIELSNKEAYVDVINEAFIVKFDLDSKEEDDDGMSTNEMSVIVTIGNFSSEAVEIKTPSADELYNGIVINDTLTTTGYDALMVGTDFGIVDLMFEYRNEDGDFYFYLVLVANDTIYYGVPVEVYVADAAGWNGQILGDSTPYYEYFQTHKTFQLTINEDNTFTLNVPKLTEIYYWYHNN